MYNVNTYIGYNLAFYLYTFDLNMYSSINNAYNVIIMMLMIALYRVDFVLFFCTIVYHCAYENKL